MLKLIIEDDEGRRTVVPFVRDEISIGRQEGNTIRLTERNVSRRHARLVRQSGTVFLEDLGSYNGVRVNGEKVVGRTSIGDGDLVQIGDYDLAIQSEGADQPASAPTPPSDAAQTLPAHPRVTTGGRRFDEPETESSAPVYEEAEPLAEDDVTPLGEAPRPPVSSDLTRRQSTSVIRVDKVDSNRPRQLLELDPEEAPRLVVLNTEFAGREFACIRTELRIGRTDDNDICLDHRSLSRTHAKLVRESDGEWRIIDMQSANGLTVNGEAYAQATLNHLDLLELGHVRLRFVGAGETWTYVPGADDRPAKRRGSKVPLFVGLGLGALALGAGAFLFLRPAAAPAPEPQPAPPQARVEAPVKPEVPEPAPEAPAPDPAEAIAAEANAKLGAAQEAINGHDFETAVQQLEALKSMKGVEAALLADAEDLLDQARAELLLKDRLDEAAEAIDDGKFARARKLLEDASSTAAWADRHLALKDALAAAMRAAADSRRRNASSRPARAEATREVEKAEPEAKKPSPAEDARKLFEEGLALFNKKQHREARTLFSRCLDFDPTFAKCHLMLGSTYARLGEVDSGARHYRMFVKLAPNAPEAPKVRIMLEQYESSKPGNAN